MTLGETAGDWPRSTLGAVAQWGSGGLPSARMRGTSVGIFRGS